MYLKFHVIKLLENKVTKDWNIKQSLEKLKDDSNNYLFSNLDIKKIYSIMYSCNKKNKTNNLQLTKDDVVTVCENMVNSANEEDPFVLEFTINPVKVLITSIV